MRRLPIVLFALAIAACDSGPRATEPIAMGEATSPLTSGDLAELRRRGESGDSNAMRELTNHFRFAEGDLSEEGVYWELQLARHGDCAAWKNLMFSVEDGRGVEPGFEIPERYFAKGETLRSIGASSGCPPYVKVDGPKAPKAVRP